MLVEASPVPPPPPAGVPQVPSPRKKVVPLGVPVAFNDAIGMLDRVLDEPEICLLVIVTEALFFAVSLVLSTLASPTSDFVGA